jgi:hypothetical protein
VHWRNGGVCGSPVSLSYGQRQRWSVLICKDMVILCRSSVVHGWIQIGGYDADTMEAALEAGPSLSWRSS